MHRDVQRSWSAAQSVRHSRARERSWSLLNPLQTPQLAFGEVAVLRSPPQAEPSTRLQTRARSRSLAPAHARLHFTRRKHTPRPGERSIQHQRATGGATDAQTIDYPYYPNSMLRRKPLSPVAARGSVDQNYSCDSSTERLLQQMHISIDANARERITYRDRHEMQSTHARRKDEGLVTVICAALLASGSGDSAYHDVAARGVQ